MIRRYLGSAAIVGFAGLLSLSSPASAQSYLGVNLQPYVALAGTTVTCAGAGIFTGDIGVSPGAALVGFGGAPCTNVGALLVPAASDPGQAALLIAYGVLAGRACDVVLGPNLTGLILTPGTYCVPAAATNLAGLLQLNAQGDPNASWIFNFSSTMILSVGATVQVINGGNPCGAQWLVQTDATINNGATLPGNILALNSITMNGNLTGRALARNAAVTIAGGSGSFAACGAFATGGPPLPFPIFGAGPAAGGGGPTPTLSEWAMALLMLLVASVGFAAMRRRKD